MRIIHVNCFFTPFGGAEYTTLKQSKLLKSKGHEVYFFSVEKRPYSVDVTRCEKYFPEFVDYNALGFFKSLRHAFKPFYNKEAAEKFAQMIDDIKPDLVHFHNIYHYLSPAVIDVANKKGIPSVMTVHDCRIACPGGMLLDSNNKLCNDNACLQGDYFKCIKKRCKGGDLLKSILVAVEYYLIRKSKFYEKINRFICPSEAMGKLAVKAGYDESKVTVINNFLDEQQASVVPTYTHSGYFLYAGRLSVEKGVNYVLDAAERLPDTQFHIVGSGPEEENLKSIAKQKSLSNVIFKGFMQGEELINEYKECTALLLPCCWFENFPSVIFEAFIMGKPVIASHIGGIPEMVDSGVTGFTFGIGDVDTMCEFIQYISADFDMYKKIAHNCYARAKKLYVSDIHYEKLIRVYEEVTGLCASKESEFKSFANV